MFRILFGKWRDKEIPSSSFTHKCAMITFLSTRACVYLCDRLRSHVCTKKSLGDLRPTRRVKGDTQEFQRPWGTEILHCYLVYFLIRNTCSPFEGLYAASLQCLRNIFLCWLASDFHACCCTDGYACERAAACSSMWEACSSRTPDSSYITVTFFCLAGLIFFFFKIFSLKKKMVYVCYSKTKSKTNQETQSTLPLHSLVQHFWHLILSVCHPLSYPS